MNGVNIYSIFFYKHQGEDKPMDRGKAPLVQASQPPAPDCMIAEPWGQPPPQALTVQERRVTPTMCGRNREMTPESYHSPR